MHPGTLERRISCPWCAAPSGIVLDLSGGDQSYVEDCQVCCQPMQIRFETDDEQLLALRVERA
ncbi:MAG: CPXCG motif-containing cysteine-rich protein [Woeseia sp.]